MKKRIPVYLVLLGMLLASPDYGHSDTPIQDLLGQIDLDSGNTSIDYTNAIFKLRHPDGEVLRSILEEIENVGILERKQEWDAFGNRVFRLSEAFDLMGTNLTPLLPDVKVAFLSGDSIAASGRVLVKIGGEAWTTLRQGLTNVNPRVQICAVEAMAYGEGTNADLALPFLEGFLTNNSENLRVQSVVAIGRIGVGAKRKASLLIQTVEGETNVTIRCIALKGLAACGKEESVSMTLKRASKDTNSLIRYAATESLREIEDWNRNGVSQ